MLNTTEPNNLLKEKKAMHTRVYTKYSQNKQY